MPRSYIKSQYNPRWGQATDKRNREILDERLSGRKLEDIAMEYGVTRERIRQICKSTLAKLPEDELMRAEGLMAVNFHGGIERHLLERRQGITRELRALFKTEFNREKILEIIGLDHFQGTDLDLCAFLYGKYQIKNFFNWRRCWRCKHIIALTPTFRHVGICTACNTIRHREQMAEHPEYLQKMLARQKTKPNYGRLMALRAAYKKLGQFDKMPPLPPKGTPDDQIQLPPPKGRGWEHYQWREKKAKRLVIQEARSRGIDAEL